MKIFLGSLTVFILILLTTNTLKSQDDVYMIVEVTPQFPGGEEARIKFLVENMNYPQEAIDNNIEGTVYITFVVEPDGSITNVKILRDIGGGCGKEAARVVGIMPKWTPGEQRGKPVRVQFTMPIKFTLETGKSKRKKRSARTNDIE